MTSAGDDPSIPRRRSPSSDPSSPSGGRFLPGTLLSGRYRIIGLIGRGGMGEVYRADDLKLGRTVALKFLPEGYEADSGRQQRFLEEIRLALQVSHPNVCRVHDIGEAEGLLFLSMEYVDGEDLASLLRRIGRLPRDKAIQIGRQICAGLAAAHEQGILHRDLKPANIMLDGRGRAKITDFGLAGLEQERQETGARAGTPSYMAPEQLEGEAVTVKSDLYSLGLVLYELFTGKAVYEGSSAAEISQLHRSSAPSSPSSHVEGFDPAVERAILRCLEQDPSRRPASALAVAAALPGGDPLAEALAAGETPSPEMVAAAGDREPALRPAVAVACVVYFLFATGFGLFFRKFSEVPGSTALLDLVPTPRPPAVLEHEAESILEALGHVDTPRDTARGFNVDEAYIGWIADHDSSLDRWQRLASQRPPALFFWYRTSPRLLVPTMDMNLQVDTDDPPALRHSGEVLLTLDTEGRLRTLEVAPPQHTRGMESSGDPDWEALFRAADLEMADYDRAEPEWSPPTYADVRAAWERDERAGEEFPERIEAAAFRGRPVYFQSIHPWQKAERMEPDRTTWAVVVSDTFFLLLFAGILVAGVLLARRNLRMGRGDRKGALRLSIAFLALIWTSSVIGATHIASLEAEADLMFRALLYALFLGCLTWLVYIALEPFARKHWPVALISWSRLLAGRIRDPLIGRDIVIGAAVSGTAVVLILATSVVYRMTGTPAPIPRFRREEILLGGGHLTASLLWNLVIPVILVMNFLFVLLVMRRLLRKNWLACGLLVLAIAGMGAITSPAPWMVFILDATMWAIIVAMLARYGILSPCFALFFLALTNLVSLSDLGTWYGGRTVWVFALMVALLGYGLWTSIGGRLLLERTSAEES